jgi:hypothetical protein
VLWAQEANSSVGNVVGVWDGERVFPSQFVLRTPAQRADLQVGRFCSSESLQHLISSSELSHKIVSCVGYTPQTSVVNSNRFGIRVELGLPLGRYRGISLHCEDYHCKRSSPWSPTCSFSIVSLMCISFVSCGLGVIKDPVPKDDVRNCLKNSPACQPSCHHHSFSFPGPWGFLACCHSCKCLFCHF